VRHAYAAHLAVTLPCEADVTARPAHDADARAAAQENRDPKVPTVERLRTSSSG
jgi:hypothetical protein